MAFRIDSTCDADVDQTSTYVARETADSFGRESEAATTDRRSTAPAKWINYRLRNGRAARSLALSL